MKSILTIGYEVPEVNLVSLSCEETDVPVTAIHTMEGLLLAWQKLLVPVAVCIQNSAIPKDEQFWSEGALTPPSSATGGLPSSSSLPAEINNLFHNSPMPPSMNMLPSPTMSRQLLRSQTHGGEGPIQFDTLAVDDSGLLNSHNCLSHLL